jgi:hypothetical protein
MNGILAVGSSAVLGGWLLAIILALAFHDELAAFFGKFIRPPSDAPTAAGFCLKKPLFNQPLNMILRLVLRLLDKLANLFEACGFLSVKEKLDDFGLRLFMFFFVRAHGDVLGNDYDDYCAKFYPDDNPPNEKS